MNTWVPHPAGPGPRPAGRGAGTAGPCPAARQRGRGQTGPHKRRHGPHAVARRRHRGSQEDLADIGGTAKAPPHNSKHRTSARRRPASRVPVCKPVPHDIPQRPAAAAAARTVNSGVTGNQGAALGVTCGGRGAHDELGHHWASWHVTGHRVRRSRRAR